MRYLHQISAHEKFVARGEYRRTINNEPSRYTESWTIHALKDGEQFIRIDQDARFDGGWSRLVEVLRSADGQLHRLTIRQMDDRPSAEVRIMRTDYQFESRQLTVSRQLDTNEKAYDEIDLPDNTIVRLTEFNLFWGDMIRFSQTLENKDKQPVYVPFFKPDLPPGKLVTGAIPTIESVEPDTLLLGETAYDVQRVKTQGHRMIWLDTHGIPLRLAHPPLLQDDVLTNYAYSK